MSVEKRDYTEKKPAVRCMSVTRRTTTLRGEMRRSFSIDT
jgi:hypothetical protein